MSIPKNATAEILIVEDEVPHAEVVEEGLTRMGHRCTVVHDGPSAVDRMKSRLFDIIITDLMLGPNDSGMDVLKAATEYSPASKVILITAHSSISTCRDALKQGAFDYIEKPLDLDDLRMVVGRAAEITAQRRTIIELKCRLDEKYGFDNITGISPAMMSILNTVRRVAPTDLPVMLLGESGTGKELIANAIHNNSNRRDERFVAINCAGFTESLLEDELFGHVKGAYTGSVGDRQGRFEYANGGTVFLDEVGDMPMGMQAKLLRVLESGELVQVGSNEPTIVDIRIISATNHDLAQRVADKQFREDLYFRIKGSVIDIPPLRQRREDIPLLIDMFITQANDKHDRKIKSLDKDAARVLLGYAWPGNVRQLRNVVENIVVMAPDNRITLDDLPSEIYTPPGLGPNRQLENLAGISIEEAEKELIRNTLAMVSGNREQAANILGIGERTLYRKIKEYDLKD
ncbi:MAG: sigma-54 dependent transcriptional regulator [Phycisphaerae bacterium]|jgi:two-component system response regulator HydG|nr:sigma-54 dependent transcriptional regulator [Phycisphaerae bacterium]MDP7287113.1 sigma-54 dependent transcriptional regulator [Phycisphaerae bacterium]